jgi:hypothetical protein
MAGNTAVISMVHFAVDWADHVPIAALCERYSVTKDQVLRLKVIWKLAPRHDRSLRAKPKWSPKPSSEEDKASGDSCDLAPEIARRVAELKSGVGGVQIHGTHCRPEEGTVPFTVQVVGIGHFHDHIGSRVKTRDFFDDGSG